MEDTDLHGHPTPPPNRGRRASDLIKRRRSGTALDRARDELERRRKCAEPRPTPAQNANDKKLDRSAAFYANVSPPGHPHELRWRHHHWQPKREKVRAALAACAATETQLHNFDNCGSCAATEWSETAGRRRLTAYYCKGRHCEPCARAKAGKIAANLRRRLEHAKDHEYRLMTFTLKHSDEPLAVQIQRLYRSFKRLRNTALWKRSQKGGAMMLEVKWTGEQWHPHAHCVVQGRYIDKYQLSAAWHRITKDSYIIDVRKIDRHEDAAHYVTKYITKSTSNSVWDHPDRAMEWVTASKGLRTCATFGTWRKWPLLKVEGAPTDWTHEDTLVNWFRRARAGELVAAQVLNLLRPHHLSDQQLTDEESHTPNQETDGS